MQTIKLNTRVGADGILKLELPLRVSDAELEVLVVVQPVEMRAWPPGYFDKTAGSLADTPIERAPQGWYEQRDPLQ